MPITQTSPPLYGVRATTSRHLTSHADGDWNPLGKILIRFFSIYFFILVVPLDWKYYRDVFSDHWGGLHFSTFFYAFKYAPRFVSDLPVVWDWIIAGAIAAIGAIIWSKAIRNDIRNYDDLYYGLRVMLRYRLATALIAFALLKIFPLQMPEPSISNLNTHYGDVSDWKVFSMSTGIVPGYQSFLGWVELIAALLLLNRKTATIGAFIIIPFTGNVVMSNLAYGGGEFVYSLMLVSFALFIFAYDVPRLISLTSAERLTSPAGFGLSFDSDLWRKWRLAGKAGFISLVLVCYSVLVYNSYKTDNYQYPNVAGLANAAGIYNVQEFQINGEVIPYSAADTRRWQDVVFEKWNTLSVRTSNDVVPITDNTEEVMVDLKDRNYEVAGISGRHYYSYLLDTITHHLKLENRNKNHQQDKLTLTYRREGPDRISLSGIDAKGDTLRALLQRIDKKYLLEEAARVGRRRGLKL